MRKRTPLFALLLVLAALVGGIVVLFQLRLAQGDLFPPYSSMRSDPLGIRALHDSLEQLPALRVERAFKPIEDLPAAPPRTIVMAGVRAGDWTEVTRAEYDALNDAIRAGSRLVIGFRAETARDEREKEVQQKKKEKAEKDRKKKAGREKDEVHVPKEIHMDLRRQWGAAVKDRTLVDRSGGATRVTEPGLAALPETLTWKSDLFFELDAEWQVIYRRGARPVLAERKLGLGSIVLVADSYFLSNEALQNERQPALLAWTIGPHARITFDEAHLGVQAQPGVAALAKRYGLGGAFFTLLLLAALYVWRQTALFVPPPEASSEVALTYHPAAGLEALLRRSVPANELMTVCAREWTPTAGASDRTRVNSALASSPKNSPTAALYNAAVRALRRS